MTLTTKTKIIGGEQELIADNLFYGVTNSGRSSLRWILESMNLRGKRMLVPDYVCKVVVDVLSEFDICVSYYHIDNDLSFELVSNLDGVDAVYLVRYFGHMSEALKQSLNSLSVPFIFDDVFAVERPEFNGEVNWAYFNSLRKVSHIADYSQVISKAKLSTIQLESLNQFSETKYQAKGLKSEYLKYAKGDESEYLRKFADAESILDSVSGIYKPEDKSIYLANQFYSLLEKEREARLSNMQLAKSLLDVGQFIDIDTDFPSFLPVRLKHRDKIRAKLMQQSVFLAVHWPRFNEETNYQSDSLMSLPLDTRYSEADIVKVCSLIKDLSK